MKKIIGILTVLCLLTISLSVAGESNDSTFPEDIKCTEMGDIASWTCMYYLVGDGVGNLPDGTFYFDENMIDIFNMIELSGSTSEVNIVIQADDTKIWGGDQGKLGGTRRYLIQYDNNTEKLANYTLDETVWYLKEQNMGDPNTLKDFITWAMSNFPAKHYILMLGGHGEGWLQICQDYSSGWFRPPINYLDPSTSISIVPELDDVLSYIPRLDLLYLKGCHMGQIEVFYQFRKYADIILATENFGAGSFKIFVAPFENLTSNPNMTAVEIAQLLVDNYNPELEPHSSFYGNWSPLFGIPSKDMDNITQAVNNLTEAIIEQYPSNPITTRLMLSKAFEYSTMKTTKEDFHDPHAHELYEFAEKLCDLTKNTIPSVYNAALEVISVIDNSSIIKHSNKTFHDYHGLGIFSPPRSPANRRYYYLYHFWGLEILPRNRYKSLDFAEDTRWDEILDIMYPLRRIMLKIFNLD